MCQKKERHEQRGGEGGQQRRREHPGGAPVRELGLREQRLAVVGRHEHAQAGFADAAPEVRLESDTQVGVVRVLGAQALRDIVVDRLQHAGRLSQ